MQKTPRFRDSFRRPGLAIQPRISVYLLEKIGNDPRYAGFQGGIDFLRITDTVPQDRTNPNWRVKRLSRNWVPFAVGGQVRKFNDYPCVNLVRPAFSMRAVDALRPFLEANGEMLPLESSAGIFFAYNLTTVADVLDLHRSRMNAFQIERYEFISECFHRTPFFVCEVDLPAFTSRTNSSTVQ